MYEIIKLLDGSFLCRGMIQNGTERWKRGSLDDAIQSMKEFAAVMNCDKDLAMKQIRFSEEIKRIVTITLEVPWEPDFGDSSQL